MITCLIPIGLKIMFIPPIAIASVSIGFASIGTVRVDFLSCQCLCVCIEKFGKGCFFVSSESGCGSGGQQQRGTCEKKFFLYN